MAMVWKWGNSAPGTPGGVVTWSFALTSAPWDFVAVMDEPAFQAAVRKAFDAWEAVLSIDFVEVPDTPDVDVSIGWGALPEPADGMMYGGVREDPSKLSGWSPYAGIAFDIGAGWFSSRGPDFYTVALHEIGHVLGLGHSDNPNSVMAAFHSRPMTLTGEDIALAQAIYGPPGNPPGVELGIPADLSLVAATYQFFTGKVPMYEGFEYLISSSDNHADLNDPYYGVFNLENRYINFSNNLGSMGEGAAAFDAAYGNLTFAQAVAKAYDEIVGISWAQQAGVDVNAALAFFEGSIGFYQAVAAERVVPSGVSLDDATKVVMIGSVLHEAIKAGVGVYAEAIENFVSRHQNGLPMYYGNDLIALGPV